MRIGDWTTQQVGIFTQTRIPAGIEISEWYRAPLVVAIQQDHPLARRPSLSLSQLKAEPFVTYPREAATGLYWRLWIFARTRDSGRASQQKCWSRQQSLDWLPQA
jgi:DNA-binding transcriptional LysR family regulator